MDQDITPQRPVRSSTRFIAGKGPGECEHLRAGAPEAVPAGLCSPQNSPEVLQRKLGRIVAREADALRPASPHDDLCKTRQAYGVSHMSGECSVKDGFERHAAV